MKHSDQRTPSHGRNDVVADRNPDAAAGVLDDGEDVHPGAGQRDSIKPRTAELGSLADVLDRQGRRDQSRRLTRYGLNADGTYAR
ncbi:hypothetical protein AB0H83_29520 [Dactylosporangium sp. NPDC050688]|uniref:hypothetical protein n=1 Tax=Dactylosporangium sp. NPDC050688 TaxID=3157217 RepID=UPI003404D6B2